MHEAVRGDGQVNFPGVEMTTESQEMTFVLVRELFPHPLSIPALELTQPKFWK